MLRVLGQMDEPAILFGDFRVLPKQRSLFHNGGRVALGNRPFDILLALIERKGEFVSKEDLFALVWPGTTVEEGSLRVSMSALRKALQESRTEPRYIVSASNRGYSFIGALVEEGLYSPAAAPIKAKLATRVTRPIGRDGFIAQVAARLLKDRFVSIVGPGGVGKTTVGIALANSLADRYEDGVWLADLSTLANPELLANSLATMFQIEVSKNNPLRCVVTFLSKQRLLLVLDNCEHLLDATAMLSEMILAGAAGVDLVATSREPLRAMGEVVFRLQPLTCPLAETTLFPEDLRAYSAVELFLDRAGPAAHGTELGQDEAGLIAKLCRELDGIPLAIELAAARVEEFGLQGVVARLADRFSFLTRGWRTASDRQKTLSNTVGWSFSLLSAEEREALCRLSVFRGSFPLASAVRVVSRAGWSISQAEDVVGSLVLKSLVDFELVQGIEHYRLLEMTREYAFAELRATDGRDEPHTRRAHALDVLKMVQQAEAEWLGEAGATWRDVFGRRVDDVRVALDWAFSNEGDAGIGVQIAAHSNVFFTVLGLSNEYLNHIERALARHRLDRSNDRAAEMRLLGALGNIHFHARGSIRDDVALEAFRECFEAAKELGDGPFYLQALSAWCAVHHVRGDYKAAIDTAEAFDEVPGGSNGRVKHRTIAHSWHYYGDIERSMKCIDLAIGRPMFQGSAHDSGAQYDQRNVTLRSLYAKTLWLTGKPDRAMEEIGRCLADASGHPISLCIVYATCACTVAFAVGGRPLAEPYIRDFKLMAGRFSLEFYEEWSKAYDLGMLDRDLRRGTSAQSEFDDLDLSKMNGIMLDNLSVVGETCAEPWVLRRALDGMGGWCRPEALRTSAELELAKTGDNAAAILSFRHALALAVQQGTLAWELRSAISLARALAQTGQRSEGHEILSNTYARFAEGFESLEMLTAKSLLADVA